jgi:membrane protein DedA with SNARE-associated domain
VIEHLIAWLSGLPSIAVYTVIGLLAAVENIFPPVPADTAVVLGAFLAHRGVTLPWAVFGVTIVFNMASAMGMYFLGARHARTLFQSRVARRLLPDDGVAFVQQEYARYGMLGLFIGRLLPGFRSIVPPFAGMIHLGAWRTFVPMLAASSLWYGGLVFAAAKLGDHWDELMHTFGTVNRGLGIAAGVAVAVIAFGVWQRRRRTRRTEP